MTARSAKNLAPHYDKETSLVRSSRTALALPLALMLTACGTTSATAPETKGADAAFPMSVTDCGEQLTIEQQPRKIFTVGTAAVATLDAAGASDRIAYRSGEFGAELPTGLAHSPTDATIVDPSDPGTEAILDTDADAVYGYGLFNAKADQLSDQKIALLTVQGECGHDAGDTGSGVTFSTVTDDITRLGRIFGTSPTAEESARTITETVAAQHKRAPEGSGSVAWLYYFGSSEPLSAYGRGGMPNEVMEQAKLKNVYASESKTYLKVTPESLLEHNPRSIILTYGLYGEDAATLKKKFLNEPGADRLDAVKEGRIIMLPAGSAEPSPTAVGGLTALVDHLSKG